MNKYDLIKVEVGLWVYPCGRSCEALEDGRWQIVTYGHPGKIVETLQEARRCILFALHAIYHADDDEIRFSRD